jgi:hypothetical protein
MRTTVAAADSWSFNPLRVLGDAEAARKASTASRGVKNNV